MKKLFASALSLLTLMPLIAARPSAPSAHFQVTLERSSKGWQAQCDVGCAWTELSVACGDTCRVLIDASGVTANIKDDRTDAAFGFVVSRTDKGWQAVSVAGTGWTKVAWGCTPEACRARIDESGVMTLPGRIGRKE